MCVDVHISTPTHLFKNISWKSLSVSDTGNSLRGWIWECLGKSKENVRLRELMPVQLYTTCSRIVGRLVAECKEEINKRGDKNVNRS